MNKEKAFSYTIKFFIMALISALIILVISIAYGKFVEKNSYSLPLPTSTNFDKPTIIIDAGHGGEDAGAIAPDGTLEKDLNLEISRMVYALCILNGIDAKMTRDSDTLLYNYYDDLENYTGKKKIYDLKNRLKITEGESNPIYIGIHMNKFSQAKYSGAQIYYSDNNSLSKDLATNLSSKIKEYLQPQNKRQIKRADSSIYILKNISSPAILIECGFLSNENELRLLKSEEYKAKLALTIFAGICDYI